MSSSLVSVIIPSYNHENYVQKTINSIIEQTYKNIELIVIDDGSKDSTWQKIQEMKDKCEERFINVYFETKQNEGTCKTLNKLLSLAKGEYIYLIASDDMAKPRAIELGVKFLDKNPDYALAVGNNEIIDSNDVVCYFDKKQNLVYDKKKALFHTYAAFLQNKKTFRFISSDFGTYKTLYSNNYIPNGYLIRKSIFDKIGYFTPEAPLEDWWLMLQISKYAKMKYIDEVLFLYRWHQTNTMKNSDKMRNVTEKTRQYEETILKNIDEKEVLPDVLDVKKNGACYRKIGLPFLFQILSYRRRYEKKQRVINFLGIKINLKLK